MIGTGRRTSPSSGCHQATDATARARGSGSTSPPTRRSRAGFS